MPPTDDDMVAATLHAMMALEAGISRELDASNPRRNEVRAMVSELRGLYDETVAAVGVAAAEPCREPVRRTRGKVLTIFGTSSWEYPRSAEQSKHVRPPQAWATVRRSRGLAMTLLGSVGEVHVSRSTPELPLKSTSMADGAADRPGASAERGRISTGTSAKRGMPSCLPT